MPKFTRFLLTVVIATVVGPLIGVLPFAVLSAWPGLSGARAGDIAQWFGTLLLGAYFLGGVIALIAGTIVAAVALWRQPSLMVVLVAAVVATIAWEVAFQGWFLGFFHSVRLTINLVMSVFAATVCWLLFRRLVAYP
jgi:hypothetical protein